MEQALTAKVGGRLIWLYAVCMIANIFGGLTSTLMSVYLPAAVRELLGSSESSQFADVGAFVSAIYVFGWTAGGITWGLLSDYVGRSLSLGACIVCAGLFTLLTAFGDSWQVVMIFRFLTGFGVGGILVLTPTMLSEQWPVRSRAIVIGILSIGFPIGIFSAGATELLVNRWTQAFLIGVLPLVLGILSLILFRDRAPKASLQSGSRWNTLDRSALLTGSIMFGTMLIGLWAFFSWLPTWTQSIVSGGSTREGSICMMILGAGGLLGGFISGWMSNAMGYRRAMILCYAASFILTTLLFKTNSTFTFLVYAEIGVMAVFFGASQGILSAFVPELFTAEIRATATGICFNIGRVFTGLAVFFVGFLVNALGGFGNAIFVFSSLFVAGLIATYLYREKKSENHAAHQSA